MEYLNGLQVGWSVWERTDGVSRLILLLLLLASLGSWYVIARKACSAWVGGQAEHRYLAAFALAGQRPDGVVSWRPVRVPMPYAGMLALAQASHLRTQGASAVDSIRVARKLDHALLHTMDRQQADWEAGQTYLATVASSAPFIGLLGTVWGVHNALQAIGLGAQTTLNHIAGPVGEALIMTGIGLAVALPAAIAYNAFVRLTYHRMRQLQRHASELQADLMGGSDAA
jgi:biopolymer transport protein ExbB